MPGNSSSSGSPSSHVPQHLVTLERRSDNAVLVRVRSETADGTKLPDAVFAFRAGDPQYAYWLGRLQASARRDD